MKKIKFIKKGISFLLTLCLCHSLQPIHAQEVIEEETIEEESFITEEDTSQLEGKDFSSLRLLVQGNYSIFEEADPILGQIDDMYLLQYNSIEEIQEAYIRLKDQCESISIDSYVFTAGEEPNTDSIYMDEEDNPFTQAEALPNSKAQIAMIDTGISKECSIQSSVSVLDDNEYDQNGHGTMVAQAILEQNPQASILSIKALNDNGVGSVSSIYAALDYAIEQHVQYINLSLYAPISSENTIIINKIHSAIQQGIEVIGAAGNDGNNASFYIPGCVDSAMIVGSCNTKGERNLNSNYGSSVDYNVVSDSTSLACAKMTGYLSAYSEIRVNHSLIFETDYQSTNKELMIQLFGDDAIITVSYAKENIVLESDATLYIPEGEEVTISVQASEGEISYAHCMGEKLEGFKKGAEYSYSFIMSKDLLFSFGMNEDTDGSVFSTAATTIFTAEEAKAIVELAKELYDAHATTYRWGGRSFTSASELDCAGFVNYILMNVNKTKFGSLSYGSALKSNYGKNSGTAWWSALLKGKKVAYDSVNVSNRNPDMTNWNPGDLIIFYNKYDTKHIGIYAGNGMMYHCTIGPIDLGDWGIENDGVHYEPVVDIVDLNSSVLTSYNVFHTAVAQPLSKLEGYSLSVSGDIGVNFYMKISNEIVSNAQNTYMSFTDVNGNIKNVPLSEAEIVNVKGLDYYVFPYQVSAKNICDTIQAQLYQGESPVSDLYTYTVEEYADYLINNSSNFSEKEVHIARCLLTYGYFAKEYFEYSEDDVENRIQLEEVDLSEYAYSIQDENENVDFIGARLQLKSKPSLKLYFNQEASFTIDKEEVTLSQEGKYYVITISDIDDMKQMYSIETTDFSLTYGIFSYGNQALQSEDNSLISLIQAMYMYNQALY